MIVELLIIASFAALIGVINYVVNKLKNVVLKKYKSKRKKMVKKG